MLDRAHRGHFSSRSVLQLYARAFLRQAAHSAHPRRLRAQAGELHLLSRQPWLYSQPQPRETITIEQRRRTHFSVKGRKRGRAFSEANRSLPCDTRSLTADFKLRRTSRRYPFGHRVDSLPRFKKLAARLVEGPTTITITAFSLNIGIVPVLVSG